MTEQANVSTTTATQNQNVASTQNVQTPAAPIAAPVSKLYTDDDVNRIVGEKKQKAYEQGRQETLTELQKQTPVGQPTVNQASPSPAAPELTADQEKKIVDQAYQRMQNDQMVHQFAAKMTEGSKKYADFEKVVTSLDLQTIPDVVKLANNFENTADIMYDLGTPGNAAKIAYLRVLMNMNPHKAYEEMLNLSNSIKKNQQARANQPDIKAPIGQIKSSNVGEVSGRRTHAETRRDPRYRV